MRGGLDDALERLARRDQLRKRVSSPNGSSPESVASNDPAPDGSPFDRPAPAGGSAADSAYPAHSSAGPSPAGRAPGPASWHREPPPSDAWGGPPPAAPWGDPPPAAPWGDPPPAHRPTPAPDPVPAPAPHASMAPANSGIGEAVEAVRRIVQRHPGLSITVYGEEAAHCAEIRIAWHGGIVEALVVAAEGPEPAPPPPAPPAPTASGHAPIPALLHPQYPS
ncbi:hypothetical protein WEI85_28850 [Actinomycetes bacterium KLBMP 9797]